MSTFDRNGKKASRGYRNENESKDSSYRSDSGNSGSGDSKSSGHGGHGNFSRGGASPFVKDKRPRITKHVPNERTGNSDRSGTGSGDRTGAADGQRRSYNPNFTRDNKPAGQGSEKPYRSSGNKYGDRSGNRPPKWDGGNGAGRSGGYKKDSKGKNGYGNKGGFKKRTDGSDYPRFEAPKATGAVRLNRFIANSGICSRREADELIAAGVVSVNGVVVTEMGSKVQPGDEVRFNGETVHGEKKVYIVMNKPKGFVTTMEDPHADKTVIDLVKNVCKERVYPVGRLDKNSVGVLLITNDGDLTRKLTHPSSNKKKIYQASLDKPLTKADMEKLAEGIELEDGPMHFDEISYVKENRKEIGVEVHSGRNRIVRRMFEALGYSVQRLDRVYFAGLTKKGLKRGAWRFLTPREVSMLKTGDYE